MSKSYCQIHVENFDAIRAKVLELMPSSMMNAVSVTFNQEFSDQLMTMPEIIDAVEQFGGIQQVNRIAFNIVHPYNSGKPHSDYSGYYSFNIPILNFTNTYLKMYTADPDMVLNSQTNIFGNTVRYWEVDINRCQLTHEVETIYPHIIDTRLPHEVINNNPTVRINMLIRLKPETLDCMS